MNANITNSTHMWPQLFTVTIQYLKSSNNDPELTTVPSTDTSKVLSGFITVMTRRVSFLY